MRPRGGFVVFDLLFDGGIDLIALPLSVRNTDYRMVSAKPCQLVSHRLQ